MFDYFIIFIIIVPRQRVAVGCAEIMLRLILYYATTIGLLKITESGDSDGGRGPKNDYLSPTLTSKLYCDI